MGSIFDITIVRELFRYFPYERAFDFTLLFAVLSKRPQKGKQTSQYELKKAAGSIAGGLVPEGDVRKKERRKAGIFEGRLKKARKVMSPEEVVLSLADPVALIDNNGALKAANKPFLELLGYSENEVKGKPFELFYRGALFTGTLADNVLKDGRIEDLDLFYLSRKGERIPVSLSASVIRDSDKKPTAVAVVARSMKQRTTLVSELELTREELKKRVNYLEEFRTGVLLMLKDLDRSERELQAAYRKLKETQAQLVQSSKLKALGELSAGLAHELNQPITVVRGLTQNMLRGTEKGSQEYDKLRLIVSATRKMEKVVNHLRVFSRIDEPRFKPVDLNTVIKDAFLLVRELLTKHSIEIKFDLKALPPVMGSANRLEQVIINLATNARDAMPEGGVLTISTRVVKSDERETVRVSVSDTGRGIHEDIVERVFDPFFTTKEAGKGTGLGLSISYGIIKEHNGEITLKTRKGKGTTFYITLPAAEAKEK